MVVVVKVWIWDSESLARAAKTVAGGSRRGGFISIIFTVVSQFAFAFLLSHIDRRRLLCVSIF